MTRQRNKPVPCRNGVGYKSAQALQLANERASQVKRVTPRLCELCGKYHIHKEPRFHREMPRGETATLGGAFREMTIAWSEEMMTDICDHLATGKSLLELARLQGYPSHQSMYRQMAADAAFGTRCARAREAGQDYQADYCVQIADEATAETAQVAKVRISARQWRASKLAPKRYGEKQQVEHSGSIGVRADEMLDDDLARIASSSGV